MTVDWTALVFHFASLSILAVGGAITTTPEMHRYLVGERAWLSDSEFVSAIALAQAAPGPNVLFVALLGWSIGSDAAGPDASTSARYLTAIAGVAAGMVGILTPSSIFAYLAGRWAHRHRQRIGVRAFKVGMGPVVVALMLATVWLLVGVYAALPREEIRWAATAATAFVIWRTRIHLLWLLGLGAAMGAAGIL